MKRDMELIRFLLLRMEGNEADLSAYPDSERTYHCALLIEAGLVEGVIRKDEYGVPNGAILIKLTWKGHDFLDAARNETIWKKVTGGIKEHGISLTFDLLKELLKKQIAL